jgi:hypothetical protein
MAKRIARKAIKAIAVAAAVVFLFARLDLILNAVSIGVLLICFIAWALLFGDEHTGWWPDKPDKP